MKVTATPNVISGFRNNTLRIIMIGQNTEKSLRVLRGFGAKQITVEKSVAYVGVKNFRRWNSNNNNYNNST